MGRTRSSAADIAESPAGFDDFVGMASLMLVDMSGAEYQRSYRTERLGDVLVRVLGRAAAQMEKRGGRVGAHTLDDATARSPGKGGSGIEGSRNRGFKNSAGAGQSHEPGVNGVGLARPNHQREAGADVFGQSMHASEGNSGAHDLVPLLDSRSSTMTKPEADRRVRSSQ